jgi:hypothetical protein
MSSIYIEDSCVALGQWAGTILGINPCVISMSHAAQDPFRTDTVLVTVQDEGIYVYSLTDMKCFKSWFVSRSVHGSSHLAVAAFQPSKDLFCVILGDGENGLIQSLMWKEQAMDLEKDAVIRHILLEETSYRSEPKSKKKKPKKSTSSRPTNIVAMYIFHHAAASLEEDLLLVDGHGNVYRSNTAPDERLSDGKCIWSGASRDAFIVNIVWIRDRNLYELHLYQETKYMTSWVLEKDPHDNSEWATIVSVAYEESGSLLSLIWSDGTWCIYEWKEVSAKLIQRQRLTCFVLPQISKVR